MGAQDKLMEFLSENMLDSSNFESDFEALENAEAVVRKAYGVNAARAFRNKVKQDVKQGKPFAPSSKRVGTIDQGSKLSFTIVAERVSANITGVALPAMLFGVNDRYSGFQNVMSLPSGVTLKKVEYGVDSSLAAAQRLDLTYTDGTNDDTIRITCNNNPYPVLLESTKTDLLLMQGVRLSISNTSLVSQFDEQIQVVKNALAGNTRRDNLTPTSYKNPEQFQSGIVDIPETISVDKQTSLQCNILATAGFKVSFNFYAGKVQKWDAADLY